jgi:hypothetical protein
LKGGRFLFANAGKERNIQSDMMRRGIRKDDRMEEELERERGTEKRLRWRAGSRGRIFLLALFLLLVLWNVRLQVQLGQTKPDMEVYLPQDLYVAVGSAVELYNNQVVICGMEDAYILNWNCQIGQNLKECFYVEGKEEQIGDYPLILEIYDWNGNLVRKLTSTLHVVDNRLDREYSVLNIGDSLSNGREWYRDVFYLSDGKVTFTGTRGWTKYSHEGRSGFSPQDYLTETEYPFEDEGVHPFYDPVQQMFDWNYYKINTGIDPDVIQIFLGVNGLKDDPTDNIDAIAQMVNNIRKYDQEIPIYIVNTPYLGDQDHLGRMELPNGDPWFQGEYKLRYDRRILHLMEGLDRKLGNYSHVNFIPLALMHDSVHNFDENEALHPNDEGYDQFAACMYSVYCGTLKLQLP